MNTNELITEYSQVASGLLQNDFFVGMAIIGIIGAVLMHLRGVFGTIKSLLVKYTHRSILITNSDVETYAHFIEWFMKNNFHQKVRKIKMQNGFNSNDGNYSTVGTGSDEDIPNKVDFKFYPADGNYWIWWGRYPIRVMKETADAKGTSVLESFTVQFPFGKIDTVKRFLLELESTYKKDQRKSINVWMGGYWAVRTKKSPRQLKSIFMNNGTKNDIVNDLTTFINSRQWYADRGIPYYRGYLLYGPPGTGKTSLIYSLACHLNLSIHFLSLNSVGSDSSLIEAFSSLPENSIIIIEDVDLNSITQARNSKFSDGTEEDQNQHQTESKITLSGLLNALDGVLSAEGRICFLTSNNPDSLDTALKRPGRLDRQYEMSYTTTRIRKRMFNAFFPDAMLIEFEAMEGQLEGNITPAAYQGLLMERYRAIHK